MDSNGTRYFAYDYENRLVSITDGTEDINFAYDVFGRRIRKDVNGAVTKYLYNGEDILAEYDSTDTLQVKYTHGPGIDNPISKAIGAQSYYYHSNHQGSITELTGQSQAVANSYQYDAYGNIINQTGTVPNPYTFTGREWDAETGLYYYRARYYDAGVSRFLSEDPIGFVGGVNFYAYVNNNPVNYIDPFGYGGIAPPAPPINRAQIQAQINSIRSQIAELKAKLNDPCLSAIEKAEIGQKIKKLLQILTILWRLLLGEEDPNKPPNPPPKDREHYEKYIPDPPNPSNGIYKL